MMRVELVNPQKTFMFRFEYRTVSIFDTPPTDRKIGLAEEEAKNPIDTLKFDDQTNDFAPETRLRSVASARSYFREEVRVFQP